jgi:hypothetical protein
MVLKDCHAVRNGVLVRVVPFLDPGPLALIISRLKFAASTLP